MVAFLKSKVLGLVEECFLQEVVDMESQEDFFFFGKSKPYSLVPGCMRDIHFSLLIEISSLYSEKVIMALRGFLVDGYTRKEVCERYSVSPGYFSMALRKLRRTEQAVLQLIPYYVRNREYGSGDLNF